MTEVEKLLLKTKAAADQRASTVAGTYGELVAEAARGAELDPEAVADFLAQHSHLGYDVARFHSDVQHLAGRLDARAKLDARPAAEKKLAAVEAAIAGLKLAHETKVAKLKAEFDAALKKLTDGHAVAIAPHLASKGEAERAVAAAEEAVEALRDSAPDELKAERDRARGQVATWEAEVDRRAAKFTDHEKLVADPKRRAAIVAEAHELGARTYGTEVQKVCHLGDGEAIRAAALAAAKRNGERFAEEDLAKDRAALDQLRADVEAAKREAAEWRAEVVRIEDRMLQVV